MHGPMYIKYTSLSYLLFKVQKDALLSALSGLVPDQQPYYRQIKYTFFVVCINKYPHRRKQKPICLIKF